MSDLKWFNKLNAFCENIKIPFETASQAMHDKEYYDLAYSQFVAGASDRVIIQLLTRAAMDANLID